MSKKNQKKLTYRFHNPNTEEVTVKYITMLLADMLAERLNKMRRKMVKEELNQRDELLL